MLNKKYTDINKDYPVILYSPYLGDENFINNKNKHYWSVANYINLGYNILFLNDNDKTMFIYPSVKEVDSFFHDALPISKTFSVSHLFFWPEGIKNIESGNGPLTNVLEILSVDYKNIDYLSDDYKDYMKEVAEDDWQNLNIVEFEKKCKY